MARRGAAAFVATPSIFTLHAVTAPMAYLLLGQHLDAALRGHARSDDAAFLGAVAVMMA